MKWKYFYVFFFFLWQCRNIKTYNCIYNVTDIHICLGNFIKFFVKLVDSGTIFTPQKILNSIFNWLYVSLQLQSKIIVKVKAKLLKQKKSLPDFLPPYRLQQNSDDNARHWASQFHPAAKLQNLYNHYYILINRCEKIRCEKVNRSSIIYSRIFIM